MAARSGVVDTSVFKGIADLHAEALSNDPVVAPAHEVVQDSDMIADPSIPLSHADAAPEHGGDTAIHSTEDASTGDTGHAHADLAYAEADHAVADADLAYADHAYADATVPDSAFADHSMMPAYDGTPHSLGADAAKGQGDDGHNAAVWWWAGGAALVAGGMGAWIGHEYYHDDASTTSTSAATPDVHVVVESTGAYLDVNGDGVHATDGTEDVFAVFQGPGANADLATDSVTIHFNDVPTVAALNLTGFNADDKIEFHVNAMMGDNSGHRSILDSSASYVSNLIIDTLADPFRDVHYTLYSSGPSGPQIEIHQHSATGGSSATDFAGNTYNGIGAFYMTVSNINNVLSEGTWGAIAYWTDADNALNGTALNGNAYLLPNYTGSNTAAVVANLNSNTEGGVVDFIWPSG